MQLDLSPTRIFQEKTVPLGHELVGWTALAHALAILAPVRWLDCISDQHVSQNFRQEGIWTVYDKRYRPGGSLADHLGFSLRHEELDLLVLKRVFDAVPQAEIEALVRATPTGILARRIWCFYEILTGRTLGVEDAPSVTAIDLLDPKAYFTGKPRLFKRHRVRDNLLGTRRFCPVIRRTKALTDFLRWTEPPVPAKQWAARGHSSLRVPPVFCCWRTAEPASKLKANGRRATVWSVGGALCCKPGRRRSR